MLPTNDDKATLCDSCRFAEFAVEYTAGRVIRYWECPYHDDAGLNITHCEDYKIREVDDGRDQG